MGSELRTVYAVRAGEYDNHAPLALFEREDDAKAALEAGLGVDVAGCVDSFTLYPAGLLPQRYDRWLAVWTASPSGETYGEAPHVRAAHIFPDIDGGNVSGPIPTVDVHGDDWSSTRTVRVTASAEDEARDVCAAKMAELRAALPARSGRRRGQ